MACCLRVTQTRFPGQGWLVLALLFLAGCHGLPPFSETALRPDQLPAAARSEQDPPVRPAPQSPDTGAEESPLHDLAGGRWWRSTASAPDPESEYRWRHEGVERAAKSLGVDLLRRAIAESTDPAARANAAIALARLNDPFADSLLIETARNPAIETNHRCAALETLAIGIQRRCKEAGKGDADAQIDPRRIFVDLAGEFAVSAAPDAPYRPLLHAEALHAAAALKLELDDPLLVPALESKMPDVKVAALECLAGRRQGLPRTALDLRTDPDPRVRMAALAAAAKHPDESTARILGQALLDADFEVRLNALHQLGTLGTDEACALLQEQMKHPGELVRAAAVEGLAAAGRWDQVLEAGEDRSWRVRKTVAQSLRYIPSHDAALLAERLLRDQSPEVEYATVEAVAHWPVQRAAPILLVACNHLAVSTRQRAAEKLAEMWPPAREFSPTAPPERRAEMLAELRDRAAAEFGQVDRDRLARGTSEARPPDLPASEGYLEARALVTSLTRRSSTSEVQAAFAKLERHGSQLIPILDEMCAREKTALREEFFTDLLPKLDPSFQLLQELRAADLNRRRRAAAALAEQITSRPPSGLLLARLTDVMAHEPDSVVWLSVWRAVSGRTDEPVIRLAYLALEHPAPEVRRQTCEYLLSHPAAEHAAALVGALDDPIPYVARAAAAALGRCGPLSDTRPLVRALESHDPDLRLEAAVSLARLGAEAGFVALERFSYEGDSYLRRETAQAMGVLADQRFLPALIRLTNDRDSVRRAAILALRSVAGADVAATPGPGELSLEEQARRWQAWWQARESRGAE